MIKKTEEMCTLTYCVTAPAQRKFVSKPWGWEDWLFNDKEANYCHKKLFIKGGRRGSIHMHPTKDEVLTCHSGQLFVEVMSAEPPPTNNSNLNALVAIQLIPVRAECSIRIKPGTWHRLVAQYDTLIYEASTYHDDNDVVRKDHWRSVLDKANSDEGL